jgi:site-specific recombinase
VSFCAIQFVHGTLATKQPAMTAAAMAASLPGRELAEGDDDHAAIEAFVDRVTQLIRSQAAGIFGNLMACAPLVLLLQVLASTLFGAPLVGPKDGEYVLHSLTLLGPTALFAAFTGVLLFASSLIAGWTENWFVFHRLDSAIAWNPRIVARLGAARAARWAAWWRHNVSGIAANVSLGMMLGLVPALLGFFGLPIEVRHVTLSTGQLAAALGALGVGILAQPAFWWCAAGIVAIGVLNLSVSFWLAFTVALRSRGLRLKQRQRIGVAIRARLRSAPLSFILPPK